MTNIHFNFYKNKPEQDLVEDLIHESIKMMGFDAHYIPIMNDNERDLLYGDDPLKKFELKFGIEIYMQNSTDPNINNDFFTKFGLEMKHNTKVALSRRNFSRQVQLDSHKRPKEGDLIYIPFLSGTGELYEIKYVNDSSDFFTLGRKYPYFWELELEAFKYSHEIINTGIGDIDFVNEMQAYSIVYEMGEGSGKYRKKELVYQGENLENAICTGIVQDWNVPTKVLKLTNITGEFSSNAAIIGSKSNSSYTMINFNPIDLPQKSESWDNFTIQVESENLVDYSENNPLGNL